jgi:MFS family permease
MNTNDPTSVQQRQTNSFTIASLLGGLVVLVLMVFGNDFMVDFVGSHSGQKWLSEYIERHRTWANIIYFVVTLGIFYFSIPFIFLTEKTKRDIFMIPAFIFFAPMFATFFVGIYRSIVILWNASQATLNQFFATYTTRVLLFILIVIISITSSLAAYLARKFRPVHYGIVELVFGVASIVFSVYSVVVAPFLAISNQLTDTNVWQAIFGFVAGVYIIVRGLANIEDGLKQGPLIPRKIYYILVALLRTKVVRWPSLLFRPISFLD